MPAVRRTLSLSMELDDALVALSLGRGESVSAMVETLLREHGLVHEAVEIGRLELKAPNLAAVPARSSSLRKSVKVAAKRPSP